MMKLEIEKQYLPGMSQEIIDVLMDIAALYNDTEDSEEYNVPVDDPHYEDANTIHTNQLIINDRPDEKIYK